MKLKDISIEELELMSYTDLTYALLKENGKSMNTPTIFREICNLLGYTDSEYAAKIGDYYTSLTLDKRFILLENNEWDVCDNHSVKIELDDEVEEEETEEEEEELDSEEEIEEDNIDEALDDESLDDDDDLDDLEIVDEEDLVEGEE